MPEGGAKASKPYRFDRAVVDTLAEDLGPNSPALIVRMGAPGESNGRLIGWSEDYSDLEKRDAASRWWRVRDPESWVGLPLLATVAEWVVGTWCIVSAKKNEFGYVEFELAESEELAKLWRHKRLKIPNGATGAIPWPRE